GYEIRDRRLIEVSNGRQLSIELLVDQPDFERVMLFYKPSLERIGIEVTVRRVDDAQYGNRLRRWDFDIITMNWGQGLSPGNEQRGSWGWRAAAQVGSRNFVGVKNPAVGALGARPTLATRHARARA